MRRPVYDGVPVTASFDHVVEALGADPSTWLPAPATPEAGGHVAVMRASGLLAAAGVPALVEVGDLDLDPPGLAVRPVAWRALRTDRVFPRLVGELELSATSTVTCRLAMVGGYQPPVSVVGDAADRLLGHHVAEAVVRTFLESVATRLVDSAQGVHATS